MSEEHTTSVGKANMPVRFRRYLLTGIVVTAPISITIYLTYVFLTFIDERVVSLLPQEVYHQLRDTLTLPGVGLFIAIGFFIIVGWFATNFMGKFLIGISEYVVERVPVIRTIYSAIKQIFETIMASQSQAFRDVVMMEYPRKGVWSIGFVTGTTKGQVQKITNAEMVNVFVPTTPNPTSGYLLFVPRKDLIVLDMTVEEGVKLVVSAGIITPPYPKKEKAAPKKKLVAEKKKSK